MNYKVVEADSPSKLASTVEALLRAGWKLQGGVSALKDGWSTYYQQAMVKQ